MDKKRLVNNQLRVRVKKHRAIQTIKVAARENSSSDDGKLE